MTSGHSWDPPRPGETAAQAEEASLFAGLMEELKAAAAPEPESPALAGEAVPGFRPASVEAMPHLMRRIVRVWGTREFEPTVMDLLIDSRDGIRQGLPIDLGSELDFLIDLNKTLRAIDAAAHLKISFAEASKLVAAGDAAYIEGLAEKANPDGDPAASSATQSAAAPSVTTPARAASVSTAKHARANGSPGETLLFVVVVVLIIATIGAIAWQR